ncbi:MAG TPA: EAL domain-containing protein [Rhodocyclaceae bacterium]|nr:EAL domain-containing protein [Rhodocyclaceae bacterium]
MMAVCYLDLDGFKPVNDQYGHAAGDRVLVEIAGRLRDCLRGSDTVARMGGDEFVLLLLGLVRIEECEAALARILKAVAAPLTVAGDPVTISASLGVALFPRDDVDVDTLLRHADQSMYLAKQSGKNRYHLFDPENDRVARDRSERLARIRQAIERREFVLYYQPQVDMQRGRVIGMEALIRWQHPERGILPPADFLSVIEDTDLIVDIGDWVIATALQQIDRWQQAGLELCVGVNIAARHLLRGDFVDRLQAHLAACPGVDPRRLDLEVLETAALEDIAHVSGVIRACQALGVSYSLDDFGTGYSSLTYLKSLPAETLKIDQTFVRDMLSDPDDRAIVQGVIGLARVFQREVIAEGVETIEHGSVLLTLGCARAQGYGIARPMPAAAVADWVGRWQPDAAWQTAATSAAPGAQAGPAGACPAGIPAGHKKYQSTPPTADQPLPGARIDLTES